MTDCKIFTMANQKGGVGETSLTVNLAAALNGDGKKVLLIDNDPQSNLTSQFGLEIDEESYTVEDVYISRKSPDIFDMAAEVRPGLWVLASSPGLESVLFYLSSKKNREMRLKKYLDGIVDKFDFIFIDNPPALNLLTINSLVASNRVIIPTQLEDFAVEGVIRIVESIQYVKKNFNPDLMIQGILANMVNNRRKITKYAREKLESFEIPIFKSSIRNSVKVPESAGEFKVVVEHAKSSAVGGDILNFKEELLASL